MKCENCGATLDKGMKTCECGAMAGSKATRRGSGKRRVVRASQGRRSSRNAVRVAGH